MRIRRRDSILNLIARRSRNRRQETSEDKRRHWEGYSYVYTLIGYYACGVHGLAYLSSCIRILHWLQRHIARLS